MPKKDRTERWKKKRSVEHREQKIYYYIFCEGERTEPLYFKGFKELIESNPIYKNMVLLEIEPCGAETMRVIGEAEKYVKKHQIKEGKIWCVYDKDSFPAERFNGVAERAESLNKDHTELQYHVAWSNECIEFWFVLHFRNLVSDIPRTEYTRILNGEFQKRGIGKYRKNMENVFQILREQGNEELAIRYAKRIIDENTGKTPTQIAPGTTVYQLVEELNRYIVVEGGRYETD